MPSVTVFSCGDIVNNLHDDGLICSAATARAIAEADLSICNFEAPISGVGSPQPKSGPHIAQAPNTIGGLRQHGFDILLLANNHIMDFGPNALAATISAARRQGMETIGAGLNSEEAYRPLFKSMNGTTIGLVNACEAQFGALDMSRADDEPGYAWINHPRFDRTIRAAKDQCDFLIVYAHAGLENYSIPLKYWRERYRSICDLGADAVIAAHPHVPQGHERYHRSLIFYSVGNFYFDYPPRHTRQAVRDRSYAVILQLERGRPAEFRLYPHETRNGLVSPGSRDMLEEVQRLNGMLVGERYDMAHEAMSLEAYESISTGLRYSLMPGIFDGKLKTSVRRLASLALGRGSPPPKELLQLHLLRNETYAYATRSVLEAKVKRIARP